jgi:hypothetical protein
MWAIGQQFPTIPIQRLQRLRRLGPARLRRRAAPATLQARAPGRQGARRLRGPPRREQVPRFGTEGSLLALAENRYLASVPKGRSWPSPRTGTSLRYRRVALGPRREQVPRFGTEGSL